MVGKLPDQDHGDYQSVESERRAVIDYGEALLSVRLQQNNLLIKSNSA